MERAYQATNLLGQIPDEISGGISVPSDKTQNVCAVVALGGYGRGELAPTPTLIFCFSIQTIEPCKLDDWLNRFCDCFGTQDLRLARVSAASVTVSSAAHALTRTSRPLWLVPACWRVQAAFTIPVAGTGEGASQAS